MPRIALYLPDLAGGGMERVMLYLAEDFLVSGYQVDLVVSQAEGAYREQLPHGIGIVVLERASSLNSRLLALRASPTPAWGALLRPVLLARKSGKQLLYLSALVRYLRSQQPDALIAAYPYCNLVALWASRLARKPVRIGITEHNMLSRKVADKSGKGAQWRSLPPLIGRMYAQADAIIAVSNGVADDLAITAGLPRGTIDTVYNPVVTPGLAVRAAAPAPHPWLEDDGSPVIVAAGRLVPQKNFTLLLNAFARLREQRAVRLIILGEGPERPRLETLTHTLGVSGDVALPGFVDNPYAAFSRAALFVLSSDYEGLGNVLIEALACGCPVVSTDCPSGPTEILQGGRFGELVPVDDIEALTAAMTRTLDAPLPAETLRQRGGEFSLERSAKRYLQLLLPTEFARTEKLNPDGKASSM